MRVSCPCLIAVYSGQVLLDDSIINIATVASSRHVGPIKARVEEWHKKLSLFSDTLVGTLKPGTHRPTCRPSEMYGETSSGTNLFGVFRMCWNILICRTGQTRGNRVVG